MPMLKGKANLKRFEPIKEFKSVRSSARRMAIMVAVIVGLFIAWRLYENNRIVNDYLYEPFIKPELQPLIVIGFIGFILLLVLIVKSEQVLIFREGIYVDMGFLARLMLRGIESHSGFIPWEELRMIIRSRYAFIGMSLVGQGPLEELILPETLKKHFDEIQELILQLKTRGILKIIDLAHPTQEPLTVVGSSVLSIVLFVTFIFGNGMNLILPLMSASMLNRQNKSLSYLSIALLAVLIPTAVKMYKSGGFSYRYEIYDEGIFSLREGKGAFTRWDEIKSITKGKRGTYKLYHLLPRAKPMKIKIGADKTPEFDYLIQSTGKLVEAR